MLTEENFTTKIKNVIGVECPFFGKLLYLYLSEGYDRCKISIHRFIQGFMIIGSQEDKHAHNRLAFNILDLDNDNELNVLNLIHLSANGIPMKSKLG